jgi:acyl-CoA thioesterase I
MGWRAGLSVIVTFVGCALFGAAASAKTKIACVGASTTSGDGSSAGHHYPDELQRLVAPDGEVRNFGVSGTTMLRNVSATYWTTAQLTQALAYQPDVAIIWFGGNDAKPENWTTHKGEFLGDYEAMIHMFQALPSHPRTYVILSLLTRDTEGIPKAVVDDEVIPLVRQAAAETGSGVVDVHDELADHPEYFPDGIHPNDTGTVAVAKLVYAVISAPADAGADAAGGDAAAEAAPAATDASAGDVGGADATSSAPEVGRALADASPAPADAGALDAPATEGSTTGTGGASSGGKGASAAGGCALGGGAVEGRASWGLFVLLVGLGLAFSPAGRRTRTARAARRGPTGSSP